MELDGVVTITNAAPRFGRAIVRRLKTRLDIRCHGAPNIYGGPLLKVSVPLFLLLSPTSLVADTISQSRQDSSTHLWLGSNTIW